MMDALSLYSPEDRAHLIRLLERLKAVRGTRERCSTGLQEYLAVNQARFQRIMQVCLLLKWVRDEDVGPIRVFSITSKGSLAWRRMKQSE